MAGQVSHQALPKLSNCPKLSTLTCTTAQTGHKHHAMCFPDTLQGLEERNPGKVAPGEDDATMFPSTFQTPYTFQTHISQTPSTFHRHPTGFERKETRKKLHQAKGRQWHNAFPSTQRHNAFPSTFYRHLTGFGRKETSHCGVQVESGSAALCPTLNISTHSCTPEKIFAQTHICNHPLTFSMCVCISNGVSNCL